MTDLFKSSRTVFAAQNPRTKDLVQLLDPKVPLFENISIKIQPEFTAILCLYFCMIKDITNECCINHHGHLDDNHNLRRRCQRRQLGSLPEGYLPGKIQG